MTNVYRLPCLFYLSTGLLVTGCQNIIPPSPSSSIDKAVQTFHDSHTISTIPTAQTTELSAKSSVDFAHAEEHVLTHSDKLIAEQASLRAQRLHAEALNDLGQPTVFVNGSAGRYNVETDISTDALRDRLRHHGNNLSAQLGGLSPTLARLLGSGAISDNIPSSVNVEKQENFHKLSVGALMPLYTGGRIEAIQQIAQGRADDQAGEVAETEEELLTLLVQRYFLVQLANQVVKVREQGLTAVKAHDHAAQRMLDVGLISKSERLQGAAALADARFQLEKASDDLRLSQRALDSLLQSSDIRPKTPLFVNHQALGRLQNLQTQAKNHHPVFTKIQAKDKQAKAVKALSDAEWRPNVSAFGGHELTNGANDWVAGINARWTLSSPINRKKMQQAASATLEQVRAVKRQAQSDIDLLVEKSWLAVTDAVENYDSLAKKETLSKNVVSLKKAGFREGLNTVIDVNDAQADLTKTRTERLKAAYDYVIALAALLTTTGEFDRFAELSNSADIRLD